jgi:hypothetical protein
MGGWFCILTGMLARVTASHARDDRPEALSIGVVYGGLGETHDYWEPHLRRLMKQVRAARGDDAGPIGVNVVYHVEGPILGPPEVEGVRTGSVSRKQGLMMVQAAVPALPVDNPKAVLRGLLAEAVDAAEALVRRRSIAPALPEARAAMAALPAE